MDGLSDQLAWLADGLVGWLIVGSYFATEATYSHMYTDVAGSSRSRSHNSLHHSPLFGLGMRAIPVSYRRLHFPGLYPVGSAPPAHQPKSVVSPQMGVQPAHQSSFLAAHVTPAALPADMSALIPPVFRIPSVAAYPGAGGGGLWAHNGVAACSRCPSVTGSATTDANHAGATVPLSRPPSAAFSPAAAACLHKSLLVPPPASAHRLLHALTATSAGPGVVPGGGVGVPVAGGTPSSLSAGHYGPHHAMFYARVLVGRSAVGRTDYRTPPPLDPADPFGRCYDSCVNRPLDPSIYVVFNSAQCYPEYIIEYVNKAKPADHA